MNKTGFLDCFDDPVPDEAVIYISDVLFQYNESDSRYTEFLGNPTGTTFVADKSNQEILCIPVIHDIQHIMTKKEMLMQNI